MAFRVFKYASPSLIYWGALNAFMVTGFPVWLPLIYSWMLVPVLELFMRPDDTNLSAAEEEMAKRNKAYDFFLYMVVLLQYFALGLFLYCVAFNYQQQSWTDLAGKTLVMGLLCGTFGINVGHELGHRTTPFEQFLAKVLLLTSLYLHFFIEHNKGHHKRVATPEDPSSARMGETVYHFYYRSIVYSYLSAWQIAARDAQKRRNRTLSLHNEMIQFHFVQLVFIALIYYFFGAIATGLFVLATLHGILLLETVNYIEHYGLQRKAIAEGKYERTLPEHSWNSNHVIGRVMLFELSRHSDHHYMASRKYQVLRHHEQSPQMPTGYPGMMLLSLVPPAWFYIMNRRVIQLQQNHTLLQPV